jgi:hypothetical protein
MDIINKIDILLNEKSFTDEEIYNILHKDCSQFIKEGNKLFRGYDSNEKFIERTPRKERTSTDTPQALSDMLDIYFKSKFGWKPRSEGVFASSSISQASMYGKVYHIFPVNGYKYIWSPDVYDLFSILNTKIGKFLNDENFKDIDFGYGGGPPSAKFISSKDVSNEIVKEFMDDFDNKIISTYTNKNLDKNKRNEVMIKCKKYYMLDSWKTKEILKDKNFGRK